MADKWQIDLERRTASFGNFIVTFNRRSDHSLAIEIPNVPALQEDQVLALASQAALALSEALQRQRAADVSG